MAKCVGSIIDWTSSSNANKNHKPTISLDDTVQRGEELLRKRLKETTELVLTIANDYIQIQQSASSYDCEKFDCSQIQEALIGKLNRLKCETISVIEEIHSVKLASSKHRYFLLFSCGTIDKLKQLLQIVGRLSELDQKLYLEEQRKPLISEESITIHGLTTIWSATICIMNIFQECSKEVFKDQLESGEYNFIKTIEFSSAASKYAKIFLMDLIITSWIQFERLVRYEDLVESLPFLCPCHAKVYFTTLKIALGEEEKTMQEQSEEMLTQLLALIINHRAEFSMLTQSTKNYDVLPLELCYSDANEENLAYFIVWHLYSLSRIVSDTYRPLITSCHKLLESSFGKTMKQFIPLKSSIGEQQCKARLSPHQEERFRLVFVMLDSWCEKNDQFINVVIELFSFFDKSWDFFGLNYFDNSEFRVQRLTIFQLFTKLLSQCIPSLYATKTTADGQSATLNNTSERLTQDQETLSAIWDRLLHKAQQQQQQQKQQQNSNQSSTTSTIVTATTSAQSINNNGK